MAGAGVDARGASARALVSFVVVILALAWITTPAFGETHRGFTGSFCSAGSGAGGVQEPAGVALNDATGDVYVVDRGNNRVDEFEGDGSFVRAWGWGVADGLPMFETCTLTCEAGIAGLGAGQLDSPEAIAVDNSASALDPSKEDVYVTNPGSKVIEKFGPAGEVLASISEGAGGVGFTRLFGVAVDPKGTVWVYDENPETFEDEIYSYSDAVVNEFGSVRQSQAGVGASVQPGFAVDAVEDLYAVYRGRHIVAKLTSSGATLDEEVGGVEGVSAVAVDSSGDVYLNSGSVVDELSSA